MPSEELLALPGPAIHPPPREQHIVRHDRRDQHGGGGNRSFRGRDSRHRR
jgi:hypothetical protein